MDDNYDPEERNVSATFFAYLAPFLYITLRTPNVIFKPCLYSPSLSLNESRGLQLGFIMSNAPEL